MRRTLAMTFPDRQQCQRSIMSPFFLIGMITISLISSYVPFLPIDERWVSQAVTEFPHQQLEIQQSYQCSQDVCGVLFAVPFTRFWQSRWRQLQDQLQVDHRFSGNWWSSSTSFNSDKVMRGHLKSPWKCGPTSSRTIGGSNLPLVARAMELQPRCNLQICFHSRLPQPIGGTNLPPAGGTLEL